MRPNGAAYGEGATVGLGGGEHRVPNLGSQSANYSCYLLNTNLTTIMHDSMVS